MAGKRTRKSKQNAHHLFLYSWEKNDASQARVNRELGSEQKTHSSKLSRTEKADFMAKEALLASTKKGIIRSLLLASLILASELVIYLGWN